MIRAIRATLSGIAELDAYLDEANVKITDDEVSVLTMSIAPGRPWIPMQHLRNDMKQNGVVVKDLTVTIRRLMEAKRIEVFNEITDSTYLFCHIGRYRFQQQWTVFRKQIEAKDDNARNKMLGALAQDLYEQGKSEFTDSDGIHLKVTLV